MPANIIKTFAKKTGKSEKEVDSLFAKAKKEAASMGMEKNVSYVTDILKTMLGIKESMSIDEFVNKFMESEEDFNTFYETLTAGGLMAGDIPDTVKYVQRPQEDEEDEDEEGKKYKIVTASPEAIKNLNDTRKTKK